MTRRLSPVIAVGRWLLALAWVSRAESSLVNITVDDYYRDPLTNSTWVTYTPSDAWKLSLGTPCDTCTAHPDPSHTYLRTWHEGVYPGVDLEVASDMYATFEFEGVAVYVFGLIPRSDTSPYGNVNMRFVVDGQPVGSYSRSPNGTDTYEYNVPVYVNKSLTAGNHTIQIYNGNIGGNQSIALLDSIVYTRDTSVEPIPSTFLPAGPTPTSSNGFQSNGNLSAGRNVPLIPIVIVGVIFLTAVIGLSLKYGPRWWTALKRRRQGLPPSAQFLQSIGAGGDRGESGWVAGTTPVSVGPADFKRPVGRNEGSSGLHDAPAEAGPGPSTQAARNAGALEIEEVTR